MENLIKALQIFLKYGNPTYPTWCEHDELHVVIDPDWVSAEDIAKLSVLGFFIYGEDGFMSYEFGNC